MAKDMETLSACPLDRVWSAGHFGGPDATGVTLRRSFAGSLVQLSLFPGQQEKALAKLKKPGITALPDDGTAHFGTPHSSYALGGGRYLLESAAANLEQKLQAAIVADIGSVTDLSSARTILILAGPDVETVLSKGVAMDFNAQSFPIGTVAQTTAHHMPLMMVRSKADEFRLFAFSSYAQSTLHWLETACHDHGFERL
uniref:sarcosine oxidase subunit gamma n=1 Tax=Pararhizobium sp. IMCC3301 TaxID=3067904 RepID=UPI00274211C6|nr:sarcosine oxidase subunit gamma family protein [Pararhizobium sp. IMCC3301]